MQHYIASTDRQGGVQLHQYTDADLVFPTATGTVGLSIRTQYPWAGTIEIHITESTPAPWELSLRIPAWAAEPRLTVNGDEFAPDEAGGYVRIERAWVAGDRVVLDLEMPVRITGADPRVDAIRGCVAIERGPLVYCIEAADNDGIDLAAVVLDADQPFQLTAVDVWPSAQMITTTGAVRTYPRDQHTLYRPAVRGEVMGNAGSAHRHPVLPVGQPRERADAGLAPQPPVAEPVTRPDRLTRFDRKVTDKEMNAKQRWAGIAAASLALAVLSSACSSSKKAASAPSSAAPSTTAPSASTSAPAATAPSSSAPASGNSSAAQSTAPTATGGTFTISDPYPQYTAGSAWVTLLNTCGATAGVKIKRTGYDTTALLSQTLLSAQQGNSPDVLIVDNPVVSTLADAGVLASNDQDNIDTSAVAPNLLAAGVLNGKTYGTPIGANTLALYYNKTILSAAGVDPAQRSSPGRT